MSRRNEEDLRDRLESLHRALITAYVAHGGDVPTEPTTPEDALNMVVGLLARTKARADAVDNPTFDATDGAHPAWWRAHDYVTERMRDVLTEAREGRKDALDLLQVVTMRADAVAREARLLTARIPDHTNVPTDGMEEALAAYNRRDLREPPTAEDGAHATSGRDPLGGPVESPVTDPNPVDPTCFKIHVKGHEEVDPLVRDCLEMHPNQFLATLVWPWESIGQDLGQVGCSAVGDTVVDATANVRRVYMRIVEEQMPRMQERLVGIQERLVLYDRALRTSMVS